MFDGSPRFCYNFTLYCGLRQRPFSGIPGGNRRLALEFKIGDKVVYPNHGLGVIEQIEKRESGERIEEFLRLRIVANDSTVMVPRSNTTSVGLRRIMSKKEIDQVYDVLKDPRVQVFDDWKGRFQENSDKMRTGSITEVALVFKSLSQLALQKNLSYRERRREAARRPGRSEDRPGRGARRQAGQGALVGGGPERTSPGPPTSETEHGCAPAGGRGGRSGHAARRTGSGACVLSGPVTLPHPVHLERSRQPPGLGPSGSAPLSSPDAGRAGPRGSSRPFRRASRSGARRRHTVVACAPE